jgi:hypothetical protein
MKPTITAIISVAAFVLAAFVVSLLVYIVDSIELKWAIASGALGLVGAGLALNSFILTLRTDNRMKEINTTLSRIEDLQREIQKEQKEQAKSSSPIVMSLQALSQYYIDYLAKQAKQKSGDE